MTVTESSKKFEPFGGEGWFVFQRENNENEETLPQAQQSAMEPVPRPIGTESRSQDIFNSRHFAIVFEDERICNNLAEYINRYLEGWLARCAQQEERMHHISKTRDRAPNSMQIKMLSKNEAYLMVHPKRIDAEKLEHQGLKGKAKSYKGSTLMLTFKIEERLFTFQSAVKICRLVVHLGDGQTLRSRGIISECTNERDLILGPLKGYQWMPKCYDIIHGRNKSGENILTYYMQQYPGDLFSYLKDNHPKGLPLNQRIAIIDSLIQAYYDLEVVFKYIHRDPKHDNTLYDPSSGSLVITDFGFSCEVTTQPPRPRTGTLDYFSFEQFFLIEKDMMKSEVFAVGIMVGYVAFGYLFPWFGAYCRDADRYREVIEPFVEKGETIRLETLFKTLPDCQFKILLAQMFDPEERRPNMKEVWEQWQEIKAHPFL